MLVRTAPEVAAALEAGLPVVALESTLVVHGLPAPGNLRAAAQLEEAVRAEGAVPATVGVLAGVPTVGLSPADLERLTHEQVPKLGLRDLAPAAAAGVSGATTVSSTATLAHLAGISVFATGGLGGVHRGAAQSWDVSADLDALSRTPIAVVCSGVKSILDVAATLERLETLGISVLGYRTHRFPGFYLADSGHAIEWAAETPEHVAAVLRARDELAAGAVVVANPPPRQLDRGVHDRVLGAALEEAHRRGLSGKGVTPFLLAELHEHTAGDSLAINVELAVANAGLAARVARALGHG